MAADVRSSDPWVLLSMAPAAPERVLGWFDGLDGLDVRCLPERTPEAVRAAIGEAEIVITDWSSALRLDAAAVAGAPRLAFVMSPAVGLDSLDLPALTEAGVVVANTAGLNAPSVAEWCLAAAFAVARSLAWVDREVRDGRWPQLEIPERGSTEVVGRRVGVVGFGAVGSRVAGLFRGIGCEVAYWTRRPRPADETRGATWRELDPLVAGSDILVVNIALTPETRGLIDARRLALLPRGAIVVDASRGGIVDHDALVAMVDSGHLRGAAVDVFATEPLPMDAAIRRSDRILLSSHAAATTAESIARIFGLVRANVANAIAGQPVDSVANGLGPRVARRRVLA
jgi:phosphoglycerate dehydrogenase-like enzyme